VAVESQMHLTASALESLSKMPSPEHYYNIRQLLHPNMIKSQSLVILKVLISGSAITTFGLPPYLGILASISPKVLETLTFTLLYFLSY